MNIFLLILIGISLSMDTFSLALSLGTFYSDKLKYIKLSLMVGIFHFVMPLLGNIMGNKIKLFFKIPSNILLFSIFIFIALEMFIDLFSKNEKKFNLSFFNMILFSFTVSMDSFTIGIGINDLTKYPYLGYLIFMIVSSVFTLLGLNMGKYAYATIGKLAKIIGLFIIIILAVFEIIKF